MKSMQYNICYSFDSGYVEQFIVSAVSLLKNALEDEFFDIYVLDGGLTKTDKESIDFLKKTYSNFSLKYLSVKEKDFKSCPLLKEKDDDFKHYHVTLPTYFRFKLPSLLNKIDKILYLDCDVIIRGSLKELMSEDIKKYAVAMVPDVESEKESVRLGLKTYFNAGVILINLDYWRKNKIENKLFDYAKEHSDEIKWQDQDILNCVLNENIKSINTKWNYQYFLYDKINSEDSGNAEILHLSGRFKPWLLPFEHPVYDIYYSYLKNTPFNKRIVDYKLKGFGRFIKNNAGGSETNIMLNATDEDVKNVFASIDKLYKYSNDLEEIVLRKTDEKIKEIYSETQKNYGYIDSVRDEIKKDIVFNISQITDKKAKELYKEIKSNYSYIDSVRDEIIKNVEFNITKATDEKAEEFYKEVKSNYLYIDSVRDEIIKNVEFNITKATDEKAEELYKEIKSNYSYIDSVRDEIIKELEFKISKETDEKIDDIYNEIKKSYEYVDEIRKDSEYESEQNTDNKLKEVYKELTKNYKYVDKVRDEIKKEIEFSVSKDIDVKIAEIYEEISKNYKYTEELRDEVKFYADEKEHIIFKKLTSSLNPEDINFEKSKEESVSDKFIFDKIEKMEKENLKLKNQIACLEEELAICQISLSKLLKEIGNANKTLFSKRKN